MIFSEKNDYTAITYVVAAHWLYALPPNNDND